MKKSKQKRPKAKRKQSGQQAQAPASKPVRTRRDLLQTAGVFGIGALVLASGGAWAVSAFRATMAERDLTTVGQGRPTIVQVHDHQCQSCVALQREARAALKDFDFDYKVADLNAENGMIFASRHRAGQTTLLFFDGAGNVTNRIVGLTSRDDLIRAFQAHQDEYGA